MKSSLMIVIFVHCFGYTQGKPPSLSCPDGQFALKNQCVLCHPTCSACEGHELFQCTGCGLDEEGRERFLHQGHCRLHCPRGSYPDTEQYACLPCMPSCQLCTDAHVCAKCRDGYRLQNGVCQMAMCAVGQVQDSDTGECFDCEIGCKTCSTDDPELCFSCGDGYFLYRHQCRQHCPQRTYEDRDQGLCLGCPEPCSDCRTQALCLACQPGHFLSGDACVKECPANTFGDTRGWHCQSCHSSCLTCHGQGVRDCDTCAGWNQPIYGKCPTANCPQGQYFDGEEHKCLYCDDTCKICYGPRPQNCYVCATGYMLEQEGVCVEECPPGFFANTSTQVCEHCGANCDVCRGQEQCVSCSRSSFMLYLHQGACWSECPDGFLETEEGVCEACDAPCRTCDGSEAQCLSCQAGFFLENGVCRSNCSLRNYAAQDGTCRRCAPHCEVCGDSKTCTRCSFLYLLLAGGCRASCPEGYFEDLDQGLCVPCHPSCATCSGPLADDCESCSALTPKLYEGTCSGACPVGTYYQPTEQECQECHQTCARCVGPEPTQCSQCERGLALDPNTLMCGVTGDSDCPPGTFLHDNQFTCQACYRHCQSCEGPGPRDCLTCGLPRYLYNSSCVSGCPTTTYSAHEEADGVELGFCLPCDHVCTTCDGASPKDCLTCAPGYLRLLHLCVSHCPTGYYAAGARCEKCDRSCEECEGPGPGGCGHCPAPLLDLQGTRLCVERCPQRFFQSRFGCSQCHTSCQSCTDNTPQGCATCDWGSVLQDGVCYPRCEEGHFYSETGVCELCDGSCGHCSGAGPEHCLTCHPGFALHAVGGRCVPCCQPAEEDVGDGDGDGDGDCCTCEPSSALCVEAPVTSRGPAGAAGLSAAALRQTSAVLPAALTLVLVLTLVPLGLAWARARRALCWRPGYERLSGGAGDEPPGNRMPHGVPEPEDSGDEADVVYTSRDGSVYRRYGFIHEPDTEEEEEEVTHLNRIQ